MQVAEEKGEEPVEEPPREGEIDQVGENKTAEGLSPEEVNWTTLVCSLNWLMMWLRTLQVWKIEGAGKMEGKFVLNFEEFMPGDNQTVITYVETQYLTAELNDGLPRIGRDEPVIRVHFMPTEEAHAVV